MTRIKTCPVAFNLDDPIQSKMFEHLKSAGNRSSYLKMLLFQDMQGIRPATAPVSLDPDVPEIDDSFMEEML